MKLGSYPALSLKDARAKAKEAFSVVAAGNDPQAQKLVARETYASSLFPAMAKEYIEHYAKRKTKPSTWRETERILLKQFALRLNQVQINKISRMQIEKILHEIIDNNGPSAANHAYSTVRTMLIADSDDVGRGFRLKPATYSDRSRPPIPGMSATPPGWCSRVDAVDTIWR